MKRVVRVGARDGDSTQRTAYALLGLDPAVTSTWPSQSEVAEALASSAAASGKSWAISRHVGPRTRPSAFSEQRSSSCSTRPAAFSRSTSSPRRCCRPGARATTSRFGPRGARAVTRAAVEVERTMSDPRFVVRRDGTRVLIARTAELGAYASRLGSEADRLAGLDPLAPPGRALEKLRRDRAACNCIALTDSRLLRAAAAASQRAAVSSRQELYPRGMPAVRALKLSQGALIGVPLLTVTQIRDRVESRYPEAEKLPDPPVLDALLAEAGFELRRDPTAKDGAGSTWARTKRRSRSAARAT